MTVDVDQPDDSEYEIDDERILSVVKKWDPKKRSTQTKPHSPTESKTRPAQDSSNPTQVGFAPIVWPWVTSWAVVKEPNVSIVTGVELSERRWIHVSRSSARNQKTNRRVDDRWPSRLNQSTKCHSDGIKELEKRISENVSTQLTNTLKNIEASISELTSIQPIIATHADQPIVPIVEPIKAGPIVEEIAYISSHSLFFRRGDDNRDHVEVTVRGKKYIALLDSGAQVNVIGANWFTNMSD